MTDIRKFVEREISLKENLSFGAWIRHIKSSHDELLRLVTQEATKAPIRVEVRKMAGGSGQVVCSTYEIPSWCDQIIVTTEGKVLEEHDGVVEEGRLVSCESAMILASGR